MLTLQVLPGVDNDVPHSSILTFRAVRLAFLPNLLLRTSGIYSISLSPLLKAETLEG
jgi:hypothetical protein